MKVVHIKLCGGMKIFLYTGKASEDGKRMQQELVSKLPEVELHAFQNIEEFARPFHMPGKNPDVVVLFITFQKELNEFLAMKSVLLNIKIILVLSDRDSDTIAMAHTLLPRYISYRDNDMSDVIAVLNKISGCSQPKKQQLMREI